MGMISFLVANPSIAELPSEYSAGGRVADIPTEFTAGGAFELPSMKFPLIPTHMRAGYARAIRRFEPLLAARPLAFVGTEEFSREWLTYNKDYLIEIGAVVLLVSVESNEAFDSIGEQFPELGMLPMPGDAALAEELGLEVWPVLYDTRRGEVRQ